ncbi:MAG: peptidoglycan DD-metalloendopeptidase family protein [Oscillospiraceae bacterium]|nr:peptidoglycan DD-metalloendopeptidase family protein [Oscillospiraceae bacterium]
MLSIRWNAALRGAGKAALALASVGAAAIAAGFMLNSFISYAIYVDEPPQAELLYVLEVDGRAAGAAGDSGTLEGIISGVMDAYSTDDTVSTRFLETVSVTRRFVEGDVARDEADIIANLSYGGGGGAPLTVESVELVQTEAAIPFEVEYVFNDDAYGDEGSVIGGGKNGAMLVTTERVLINGRLRSARQAGAVTVEEPVNLVVSMGTKERPATSSYGEYIMPADGPITSYFGYRASSIGSANHQGIDIAGFLGQEIRASDGGEVIYAGGGYSGYGNLVQIKHDNGDVTYYAHCDEFVAAEGERVARGQVIARMGRTGVASGVHCHFEIRVAGEPVDPLGAIK